MLDPTDSERTVQTPAGLAQGPIVRSDGVRATGGDAGWPAIIGFGVKGLLVEGNAFSFSDLDADADHQCVRFAQIDPGDGFIQSTDNVLIGNVIRAKNGAPTSATDGTVVGTQT